MSQDPYQLVQAEIQAALQAAEQLRSSYLRIRSTARTQDSEELVWARNEVRPCSLYIKSFGELKRIFLAQLKATLSTLEADLDELEASVAYVSSPFSWVISLISFVFLYSYILHSLTPPNHVHGRRTASSSRVAHVCLVSRNRNLSQGDDMYRVRETCSRSVFRRIWLHVLILVWLDYERGSHVSSGNGVKRACSSLSEWL